MDAQNAYDQVSGFVDCKSFPLYNNETNKTAK